MGKHDYHQNIHRILPDLMASFIDFQTYYYDKTTIGGEDGEECYPSVNA